MCGTKTPFWNFTIFLQFFYTSVILRTYTISKRHFRKGKSREIGGRKAQGPKVEEALHNLFQVVVSIESAELPITQVI